MATHNDMVREILGRPGMTDDECSYVLWEHTPYPLLMGEANLRPYLLRLASEQKPAHAYQQPETD